MPKRLDGVALAVNGDISRQVSTVERSVRALNGAGAGGLAGIARFLLRSEAIASSRIEGIAPSALQVALAELGQSETVRGVSDQAKLVANNMTVVRGATTELVEVDLLTVDHIVELHRSLLPDEPRDHGLRTVQNWIGTSSWTPIAAAFVPLDPDRVPVHMTDLVDDMNGSAHAPLIQAAVVHAQFETIHPFTDGNGRVGRTLIHTVLARRGLTGRAVLPISLVLATLRDHYVTGLTDYRHTSPRSSAEASESTNTWLATFVGAAEIAVEQSEALMARISELRDAWADRLTTHRVATGVRPTPRADSAVARLLAQLPDIPVVTATTLAKILGVSFPAASAALEELRQAGILTTKSIGRRQGLYRARGLGPHHAVRAGAGEYPVRHSRHADEPRCACPAAGLSVTTRATDSGAAAVSARRRRWAAPCGASSVRRVSHPVGERSGRVVGWQLAVRARKISEDAFRAERAGCWARPRRRPTTTSCTRSSHWPTAAAEVGCRLE